MNHLLSKREYSAKINPATGLYIETWVRKPEEIESSLQTLKVAVLICTQEYIAKIKASAKHQVNVGDDGEQGRLNKIIAALNFDDSPDRFLKKNRVRHIGKGTAP